MEIWKTAITEGDPGIPYWDKQPFEPFPFTERLGLRQQLDHFYCAKKHENLPGTRSYHIVFSQEEELALVDQVTAALTGLVINPIGARAITDFLDSTVCCDGRFDHNNAIPMSATYVPVHPQSRRPRQFRLCIRINVHNR